MVRLVRRSPSRALTSCIAGEVVQVAETQTGVQPAQVVHDRMVRRGVQERLCGFTGRRQPSPRGPQRNAIGRRRQHALQERLFLAARRHHPLGLGRAPDRRHHCMEVVGSAQIVGAHAQHRPRGHRRRGVAVNPPLELMAVKYVAAVRGPWCSFRVFTTGRPDTYLFDEIDPWGCSTGLQVPVHIKRPAPGSALGPASGPGLPGLDNCRWCRGAGAGAPILAPLRGDAVSGRPGRQLRGGAGAHAPPRHPSGSRPRQRPRRAPRQTRPVQGMDLPSGAKPDRAWVVAWFH